MCINIKHMQIRPCPGSLCSILNTLLTCIYNISHNLNGNRNACASVYIYMVQNKTIHLQQGPTLVVAHTILCTLLAHFSNILHHLDTYIKVSQPCPVPVACPVTPASSQLYSSIPVLTHHPQSWTRLMHIVFAKSVLNPYYFLNLV